MSDNFYILDWYLSDDYRTEDALRVMGHVPEYLNREDRRDIAAQLIERYPGALTQMPPDTGWNFWGDAVISHPSIGNLKPAARAVHMNETIFLYPDRFFCIQKGEEFTVGRFA